MEIPFKENCPCAFCLHLGPAGSESKTIPKVAQNLRQYLNSDLECSFEVHPTVVPTYRALALAKGGVGALKG